ncbi:MAG: hypothetical protein RMY16_22395 [Nostoc sp. DedQUE12b]|uniref:hypothetical protein n=1 Tax=Nostoc sp. DedQUE12b TaxID=3075398 RepID=UPI002AD4DB65|nr:hypothetical protein [Nostoc sp. DedQUE12b]MDZ8088285.1 hypothetical protein [Nostoc sp. DedQUE12b]
MDTASSSYGLILAVLWLAIAFYRRGVESTEKKKAWTLCGLSSDIASSLSEIP